MQEYVPEEKLAEVERVLYGANQGKPVQALPLAKELLEAAQSAGFDLQAYQFRAAPEQLRPPRIVRVGLVQNAIKAPTTAPYAEQREVGREAQKWPCCGPASLQESLRAVHLYASSNVWRF
jgi:beta-ureidopropionase